MCETLSQKIGLKWFSHFQERRNAFSEDAHLHIYIAKPSDTIDTVDIVDRYSRYRYSVDTVDTVFSRYSRCSIHSRSSRYIKYSR